MTARTWRGGMGDWYDASRWITAAPAANAYPLPGDTARVDTGVVRLVGSEAKDDGSFDDQTVLLGATDPNAPAELLAVDAYGQIFFDVTARAGRFARFVSLGTTGFDGSLTVNGDLTLGATRPSGGEPAVMVLTSDAFLTVGPAGTLTLAGTVKLETAPGQAVVESGGRLVNDGTLSLLGSTLTIASGAALDGSGTIHLGDASTLDLSGSVPDTQTIAFDAPGALLKLDTSAAFGTPLAGFARGDAIDLKSIAADDVQYDPGSGTLTVRQGGANGAIVAALPIEGPIEGVLRTASDGAGGTLVEYADARPRLTYAIAALDQSLGSDVVRATMTTPAGAPIDGSGVKIGIISDSFDAGGTAAAAAKRGYLPYDARTGTAAVSVLKDDPAGGDEGQAMAELIHQIAPGAQLYFCTGDNNSAALARAVQALQAAGCNIITDDLGYAQEPYFQIAGPVDTSIEHAIGSGTSYFTAASNLGNAFFQSAFDPVATGLHDDPSQTVQAQRFGNGTPYQTITVTGGERAAIDLSWDAPYPTKAASVADALVMKLYDTHGNLVATSHQLKLAGAGIPEVELDLRPQAAPFTRYRLAIYHVDGTPAVGQFSYTLGGVGNGTSPGGFIDDPGAGMGAGTTSGHDLVPGANTVGAADWSNAPAFGTSRFPEGFSSSGPGELLFDQHGNRRPAPVSDGKVTFLAPDGVDVSTPGYRPFFGTSAAAPAAAAVAALMLQADPALTPHQVTRDLDASAVDMGLPAPEQGAGFIQADRAVALASHAFEGATLASFEHQPHGLSP